MIENADGRLPFEYIEAIPARQEGESEGVTLLRHRIDVLTREVENERKLTALKEARMAEARHALNLVLGTGPSTPRARR
jgi:hypothetical protein